MELNKIINAVWYLEINCRTILLLQLFVALAVVSTMAEPEAEADPALLYTGYYPYHYGYYGYPLVKANTGELPYTFGWTDGPNNGLGVAGRKRREADEDVVRKLELPSFTFFSAGHSQRQL